MPVAHVQGKATAISASTSAATIPITLDSAISSGSTIAGIATWSNRTATATSVTDDMGNSYTIVDDVSDTTNDQRAISFYRANITNAPITITVNLSGSESGRASNVREISGADTTAPLDKNFGAGPTAWGTGANAVTSGNQTTTANGEYIFGGTVDTSALRTANFALGTGFSTLIQDGLLSTRINTATEHQIQTSAGAIAATFTQTAADTGICFIMTFKAAAGGGPTPINAPIGDTLWG